MTTLSPLTVTFGRGDWLRLPSGALVEVCKTRETYNPEVTVRYVDSDGVRSTGCFLLKMTFLLKHAKKI